MPDGTGPAQDGAPPRTVLELLQATTRYLAGRGIDSARLDAELLLGAALGLDRLQLYVQFDRPVDPDERDRLRVLVRRRGAREPVAYLLGEKEFHSRSFEVHPGVLIPRPDTELLAERAIDAVAARAAELDDDADPPLVVDLGTGSGALAITVALESGARVLAVDVDPTALACARANVTRLGPADRVGVIRGDWWRGVPARFDGKVDVVIANPPYVSEPEYAELAPEITRHEPKIALVPGPDPLEAYRRIAAGLERWLRPGGVALVEVGAGRAAAVAAILREAGIGEPEVHRDLAGVERVVGGRVGQAVAARVSGSSSSEPE